MQPLVQPDAATHADEAEANPNLGASVLLNGLLFVHIWGNLDADDKRQLRTVGRDVRALADGLVVSVAMHGRPANELGSALARWPNVQRLLADCDDDCAAVISAAPLPKLKELVLEYTGGGEECSVLALSCTAAAGLEEMHLIDQEPLNQLR
ncbi:hypothetical protein FOA52_000894 [Chlamydomonas sp. UWO 241]|nr:hypothetical protein FOA52_000894 [Chlamydomonas sp. UWO 241]